MQGDELGFLQHGIGLMSLFFNVDQVLKRRQDFVGLLFVISGSVGAVRCWL